MSHSRIREGASLTPSWGYLSCLPDKNLSHYLLDERGEGVGLGLRELGEHFAV
ncbi:MAG: hypothetical protein UY66_C0017G0011 [Parcubacteria group bacterium GW2011_GWC1_51_35]|nr:MAG: hypothetical protein UY66_C0017G0011 [Parcubacteria group bacterium GW2011_GWC1_51_35]